MTRGTLAAALLGLMSIVSWSNQAAAQVDPVAAAVGQNVRVSLINGGRETGRLLSLSATEVVIRTRGAEVRLPLDRVRSVTKVPDSIRDGALWGAAIGAVAGLLILKCEPGVNDDCPSPHSWWYLDAPLGAGVGAIVGALSTGADAPKTASSTALQREPPGSSSRPRSRPRARQWLWWCAGNPVVPVVRVVPAVRVVATTPASPSLDPLSSRASRG
jgi:hypothetical protein